MTILGLDEAAQYGLDQDQHLTRFVYSSPQSSRLSRVSGFDWMLCIGANCAPGPRPRAAAYYATLEADGKHIKFLNNGRPLGLVSLIPMLTRLNGLPDAPKTNVVAADKLILDTHCGGHRLRIIADSGNLVKKAGSWVFVDLQGRILIEERTRAAANTQGSGH